MNAFRRRSSFAFTLIELLVVVAIIALLIAVLMPSLNTARRQARATLCATRIGQLTRSIVVYAEDYDETPPFLGTGYDNLTQIDPDDPPEYWGHNNWFWAAQEDWVLPRMPECWMKEQTSWPEESKVTNGSLFPYARYEELYRCPEFERVRDARKSQEVFNYTRSIVGRKILSRLWVGDETDDEIAPGPILRMSQPHAPAQLWMIMDEQWDYNCAAPLEQLRVANGPGLLGQEIWHFWQGAECVHTICGDMLGSYHGPMGRDPKLDFEAIQASRKGNISFYDGHVELWRDPLPYRTADMHASDFYQCIEPAGWRLFGILFEILFAQRAQTAEITDIISMFRE